MIHKDLNRLNGITHEERLENFLILLGGTSTNLSSNARLPTNNEALQLFSTVDPDPVPDANDSQSHIVHDKGQINVSEIV